VIDVRDLNDALDFPARFRAAVQGGIVEPVFSPGGKTFTFVEGAVTWEVDPQARSMHEVEPREADRGRATPRTVRPGFIASDPGSDEVPSPDGRLLLAEDGPRSKYSASSPEESINREIAETLVLRPLTVKTHVSRILTKLRARDRVQLVVIAYQAGLVSPERSA
jgi:hypothetical protein